MAKCIDQLKEWPLRGATIVIGILSWLSALAFIAFFLGLFLRDLNLYSEGHYHMSVFSDRQRSSLPWDRLEKGIRSLYTRLCKHFYRYPTGGRMQTLPINFTETPSFTLELAPWWMWTVRGRHGREVPAGTNSPKDYNSLEESFAADEVPRDDVVSVSTAIANTITTTICPPSVITHRQPAISGGGRLSHCAQPSTGSVPPLPSVEEPEVGPLLTGRYVTVPARHRTIVFPGDSRRVGRNVHNKTQNLFGNESSESHILLGNESSFLDAHLGTNGTTSIVDSTSDVENVVTLQPDSESLGTQGGLDASDSEFSTSSAGPRNVTDQAGSWSWTADLNAKAIFNKTKSPETESPLTESLPSNTYVSQDSAHSGASYINIDSMQRGAPRVSPAPPPPSPMPSPQAKRRTKAPVRPEMEQGKLPAGSPDWGYAPPPTRKIGVAEPIGPEKPFHFKPTVASLKYTRSLQKVCNTLEGDYFHHLKDILGRIREEFVHSVEGRLHMVFLLLDLVLVLLNSLFCITSYMLVVGARRKNRVFMVPWICSSGASVYGSVIYSLCHLVLERGVEYFIGAITALHIIIIIVIIVVHAVALFLVHRFFLNLFFRDRRRYRQ